MDDIIQNKCANIEYCLNRIKEEYFGFEQEFRINLTKQESIILNLQRACESSIDLANYLVKKKKLGIPQTSRDSFVLLKKAGIIDSHLSQRLQTMVGFRNIAIHDYIELDLDITINIIEKHLTDFAQFTATLLKL